MAFDLKFEGNKPGKGRANRHAVDLFRRCVEACVCGSRPCPLGFFCCSSFYTIFYIPKYTVLRIYGVGIGGHQLQVSAMAMGITDTLNQW